MKKKYIIFLFSSCKTLRINTTPIDLPITKTSWPSPTVSPTLHETVFTKPGMGDIITLLTSTYTEKKTGYTRETCMQILMDLLGAFRACKPSTFQLYWWGQKWGKQFPCIWNCENEINDHIHYFLIIFQCTWFAYCRWAVWQSVEHNEFHAPIRPWWLKQTNWNCPSVLILWHQSRSEWIHEKSVDKTGWKKRTGIESYREISIVRWSDFTENLLVGQVDGQGPFCGHRLQHCVWAG